MNNNTNPVKLVKKHRTLIVIVFVFFLSIAGIINYNAKPYYSFVFLVKTPNTLETPLVTDVELRMIAKEIEGYFQKGNFNYVSLQMGVDVKILEKVKSVQITYVQSREKDNILEIWVNIYDNSISDSIKNGIISFLNKNQFVQENITFDRNRLLTLKDSIKSEIQTIDIMKIVPRQGLKNNETNFLGQIYFSQLNINKIILTEKIFNIDSRLKELEGFKVIQQPSSSMEPAGPSKKRNMVLAIFLSGIVSIFLVLFIERINIAKQTS